MKVDKIIVIAFLFVLCRPAIADEDPEWTLSKEKSGISVFTRERDSSPIKEFKAITVVDYDVEVVRRALLAFDDYSQWYDHCKSARELQSGDMNVQAYYIEYSMPFPFSNRDAVLRVNERRSDDKVVLELTKDESLVDENSGIVRMPVSEGKWELIKQLNGKTKIVHQFMGDPGGNVPSGVVNMFLVAGPINTLERLSDYLKE